VCAALHGAPVTTFDLDVVHSRSPENVARLLAALDELGALYRAQPEKGIKPAESHLSARGASHSRPDSGLWTFRV